MSNLNVSTPVASITPDTTDNATPAPSEKLSSKPQPKDEVIYNAFTLGWQIVELKSRIQIALIEPPHFALRLVSIWRALLNRIAVLQYKSFPNGATTNTLYEPPSKEVLPYLYPPAPDYANIGIPDKDNNGQTILENFKLYDLTRRAINCLTLLYVDKKKSLIPDLTEKNQTHLIKAILEAAQEPGAGGGSPATGDETSCLWEEGDLNFEKFKPEQDTEKTRALMILTERTVKFLNAWDGFLRENYYCGGHIPQDDTELIAYEAGRSMALVSWSITMSTVPIEENTTMSAEMKEAEFLEAWSFVFRDENIIRLQHQINALSTALDDAYYLTHKDKKRDDEDALLVEPDPQRPSHIITAIKQSIDFWHRTVDMIVKNPKEQLIKCRKKDDPSAWSKTMRVALIEQANIWQTLMTGQQDLRSYKMERITRQIIQDLSDELQRSLKSDFKGNVRQAEKAMKEMSTEVQEVISLAGNAAKSGIEAMFKSYKYILWPIIIIGVCILIISVYAIFTADKGVGLIGGGGGIVSVFSAILAYFNLNKNKKEQQAKIEEEQVKVQEKVKNNTAATKDITDQVNETGEHLLQRIQGAAQQTGKAVLEAFERAFKQIKIELTGMKYSAAVSYPLVEFFAMNYDLKSDEKFITEVIWNGKDRKEDIRRVVGAAFGPLSIFLISSSVEEEEKPLT